MITKYVVIADIHIGKREDVFGLYKELQFFIDFVKKKDINFIVIAGDLWDRKVSINSPFATYANLFIRNLIDLKKPIIIVKGTFSHDLYQYDIFKDLIDKKLIYYYDIVNEIEICNMKCLIIPEEYIDNKEEYYNKYFIKKYDACFGHGMFTFAGAYTEFANFKKNKIMFTVKDFNNVSGMVDFGHIHNHIKKGNVEYTGSFSRDDFSDENPKGFLYREYDTSKHKLIKGEFIENKNAPIYKTIYAKDIPDNDVFNYCKNIRKKVNSLRIIIDSIISEEKYNNLKIFTNNETYVKLEKKITSNNINIINKDIDEKRKERDEVLNKYKNKNIIDVTKEFAKEKYDFILSVEDITEVLNDKK
jgi:DNA repair exonuclease SbcCD nuclease subunit